MCCKGMKGKRTREACRSLPAIPSQTQLSLGELLSSSCSPPFYWMPRNVEDRLLQRNKSCPGKPVNLIVVEGRVVVAGQYSISQYSLTITLLINRVHPRKRLSWAPRYALLCLRSDAKPSHCPHRRSDTRAAIHGQPGTKPPEPTIAHRYDCARSPWIVLGSKEAAHGQEMESSDGEPEIYSSRFRTLLDAVYGWSRFNSLPRGYDWIRRDLEAGKVTASDLITTTLQFGDNG